MSKVKKQHYVPQFYLKRFTFDGERIYVFDKFAAKKRTANTKDIAEEKYFYDIPLAAISESDDSENFDVQMLEKELGKIEANYSRAIKELLKSLEPKTRLQKIFNSLKFSGGKIITKKQKNALAFFIAVQYFRTKESREATTELQMKFTEAIFNAFSEANSGSMPELEISSEIGKDDAKMFHLQSLFDPEFVNSIAGILNSHIWVIAVNETNQPLYTSDHPVVKKGHIESQLRSFEGFGSIGIEITLPLSPRHILLIYERTFFKEIEKMDRRTTSLTEENVTYYNSLQVLQSYRQIYCSEKEFDLAEDMCSKNPKLNSPKKNRIQSN